MHRAIQETKTNASNPVTKAGLSQLQAAVGGLLSSRYQLDGLSVAFRFVMSNFSFTSICTGRQTANHLPSPRRDGDGERNRWSRVAKVFVRLSALVYRRIPKSFSRNASEEGVELKRYTCDDQTFLHTGL